MRTLEATKRPAVYGLDEVASAYRRHLNPAMYRMLKVSGYGRIERSASGVWVTDETGRKLLDCIAGFGVFNFGHRHPKIVDAVHRQLDIMPLSSRFLMNEVQARLADRLTDVAPGRLPYVFFCNSGTEAVEGALKLARATTGRSEIVAFERAFHGKTLGSLSVSWRPEFRRGVEPLLPHIRHVPFGDALALADAVSERTAAVLIEPVQGEGGIHVAPSDFLACIRTICDRTGALLIVDEVQTGMGRTGVPFACDRERVRPDLLCLGKALGGGVMPIAALIGTEVAFGPLVENPLFHTSTFGGNPLACAAALAALDVLFEEDLASKAAVRGEQLRLGLQALAARFPDLISEVRGIGLMVGVEFQRASQTGACLVNMSRQDFLVGPTLAESRVIRFEPPLVIEESDIERLLRGFSVALLNVRDQMKRETKGSAYEEGSPGNHRERTTADSRRGDFSG